MVDIMVAIVIHILNIKIVFYHHFSVHLLMIFMVWMHQQMVFHRLHHIIHRLAVVMVAEAVAVVEVAEVQ